MELKEEKTERFWQVKKQKSAKPTYQVLKANGTTDYGRLGAGPNGGSKVFAEDHSPWEKGILDPGGDFVLTWNRVFLFSCLVALFLDPLYFYLPSIRGGDGTSCVMLDGNLSLVITFFRTIMDSFYVLQIVIKFQTAYIAPSSRVFGRGELVMNRKRIARRYLSSDFFVDLVAALPLPQIVFWIVIPAAKRHNSGYNNHTFAMIVFLQYLPRFYLIFPLSNQIIKATGVVTKTAWGGAVYNLLLYMLASHVLGASWYLLSIQRLSTCWQSECKKNAMQCHSKFFDCDFSNRNEHQFWANKNNVFRNCNVSYADITFNYGMFEDALAKGVFSINFINKYLYCLWWGLRNLSSYGQDLSTSTFIGETLFAIGIAIMGLILFAHLIGNMQTFLQSVTVKLEEWRLKQRDTEEWMSHRQLPRNLRDQVRKFLQYKWIVTRGVDEESILKSLPTDLRRDIQHHLCLDLLRRVPFFSKMDDQLLDAICERLVSSLNTTGTYIVREGDPVTEIYFIIRGKLESSTTNGGRTGFFNSITLRPGDFCGEELLAWALLPKSVSLPSSTRTVRALVEVEAFALRAEDLKFVSNQFRRLHSKKLQHTFRFYSHHWRTWAACFIQAAWHRFKRKRTAMNLSMLESCSFKSGEQVGAMMQEEEEQNPSPANLSQNKQNIGVTILASKFAACTRRGVQKGKDIEISKLQKPEEPDFSEVDDE